MNADTSVIVKVQPGKTKRSKEIVQSSDQMYDMLRMLKQKYSEMRTINLQSSDDFHPRTRSQAPHQQSTLPDVNSKTPTMQEFKFEKAPH